MSTRAAVKFFTSRAAVTGLLSGVVFGLAARLLAVVQNFSGVVSVMSLGFIFVVPVVIGFLSVRQVAKPSRTYRTFAPWCSCILVLAGSFAGGFEGAVCIIFAMPAMLVFSSIGGWLGGRAAFRSVAGTSAMMVLPWAVMSVERGAESPRRFERTETSIEIDAPASKIWPLVVSVDSIRAAERRPALFTSIGFPRPIAATLDHPGVGGVRRASFERGVVFREAVTDWEENRLIRFTIDATTVPPTALDEHVRIGGPFFDVLNGTYELRPIDSTHTLLVLTSEDRVSTHFNFYASFWVHRVMGSIQQNILEVLKDRAEKR